MNHTIFRAEAAAHQHERLLGEVIISQPIPLKVLTLLVALITAVACIYLLSNEYTRRQTVTGFLVPTHGVVAVFPPESGLIAELYTTEGAFVEHGADLLKMQIDQRTSGGNYISQQILDGLKEQRTRLVSTMQLEGQSLAASLARQEMESAKLEADITSLGIQIETQATLYQLEHKSLGRARELRAEGIIADSDMDNVEKSFLAQRQQLDSLQASLVNKKITRKENALVRAGFTTDNSKKIAELENRLSQVDREIATAEVSQNTIIRAPVSGTITALNVNPGQKIDNATPIITIVPEDSQLYANFYVPTRAIGFIEKNQPVLLRYDAFPYQRFGLHEGRVEQLTNSILDPRELPEAFRINEPVYRVRVALPQQKIVAYGQDILLKPGMLLSADIELDRRSLFEWLLEPLYSLRGKL